MYTGDGSVGVTIVLSLVALRVVFVSFLFMILYVYLFYHCP